MNTPNPQPKWLLLRLCPWVCLPCAPLAPCHSSFTALPYVPPQPLIPKSSPSPLGVNPEWLNRCKGCCSCIGYVILGAGELFFWCKWAITQSKLDSTRKKILDVSWKWPAIDCFVQHISSAFQLGSTSRVVAATISWFLHVLAIYIYLSIYLSIYIYVCVCVVRSAECMML